MKGPGKIKQAFRLLHWATHEPHLLTISPEDRAKIIERLRTLAWVCDIEEEQNHTVQKLVDDLTEYAQKLQVRISDKDPWPPQ